MLRLILHSCYLSWQCYCGCRVFCRFYIGKKFGQTIYNLGPESYQVKQGTPTMGGLAFAAVTTLVTLILHGTWFGKSDFSIVLIVFSALSMLIGFVDDYIKVVKKRSLGLLWWQKVIGQVLIGGLFSLYCYSNPHIGSRIIIPFVNVDWDWGFGTYL